jgi:hypothetical protein
VLRDAKSLAAETGRTLTGVIEDALREVLARRTGPRLRPRITLTTVGGSGVYPGVDVDDSTTLLDQLDHGE